MQSREIYSRNSMRVFPRLKDAQANLQEQFDRHKCEDAPVRFNHPESANRRESRPIGIDRHS
jgi:hypothetical protein